jgi:hypothetical protein
MWWALAGLPARRRYSGLGCGVEIEHAACGIPGIQSLRAVPDHVIAYVWGSARSFHFGARRYTVSPADPSPIS